MLILVTGGRGFLGSHVVAELESRGHRVSAPDHESYDLTVRGDVDALMRDHHPDAIIHLAALVGGIGANQSRPGEFFYDNAMMGLNLIDAACGRVEKFVSIGTVCSYPAFLQTPFREQNLWNGYPEPTNAPYGLAKKMQLVMLDAYRKQYGMNGIHLIPVNLYGPRDNFSPDSSHVIPAMIRKFSAGGDVTLWGDGSATREFLYVEDCAKGICDALERYDSPEPVNLGSGMEISMSALADKIAALTNFHGAVAWDTTKPNGQYRRCLDISRAEAFGWKATTSLDDGLKMTVDWWGDR
jgi:GDP-L-fucose synthase